MLKLAHIAVVTPRRCGLYETTRELVKALRDSGVDSRICDPTLLTNKLHPKVKMDRGAMLEDLIWANEADVLINHSGLGSELEKMDKPIIHVAHGRPRNSFLSEVKGGTPIYSYHYHKDKDKRFKVVVTLWPEHLPYHEVMWAETPVRYVQPPVDLDSWTPEGANGYKWHGMGSKFNIVCTDVWRDDTDPFSVVSAFALFARRKGQSKIHIYGSSRNLRGWSALLKRVQDDGNLGEVRGWVKGLENVYRAADMLISPQEIYTRSIREAMACGCPVVSKRNLSNGKADIQEYVEIMERHFEQTSFERSQQRKDVRGQAEVLFNPKESAKQFLAIVKEVI